VANYKTKCLSVKRRLYTPPNKKGEVALAFNEQNDCPVYLVIAFLARLLFLCFLAFMALAGLASGAAAAAGSAIGAAAGAAGAAAVWPAALTLKLTAANAAMMSADKSLLMLYP
jgi:hypothetical protein